MYPGLTTPLLVIVVTTLAVLLLLAARQPVLRRLAFRQVARRRTEALLVIAGSLLGTAIIVGSLVVGDTLGFSVKQVAYQTLGPIDERVVSTSPEVGAGVDTQLKQLAATSGNIDGVLTARVQQAAAARTVNGHLVAEPRVMAWDVDTAAAARFGSNEGGSGLTGPAPTPGHVVVNAPLAASMNARPGTVISLYLAGGPEQFAVSRVIPARGIAGTGFGASVNRNAFLPSGTLRAAAAGTRSVTWVSNVGGVESGNTLSTQVTRDIHVALGPLTHHVTIESPKRDVLRSAAKTGDVLGALFLMIGSFSIIAGALLLVNIFVMLAEERKGQLGMLRATGLRRSRLVAAFSLEGAAYAVAATLLGVVVGVGVGRGVALIAAKIFETWSADGSGLDVTFAVSWRSLLNGALLGLVIALATIVATSVRISRFNIIAAIRDLPSEPVPRTRRRVERFGSALAVAFAVAAVPAVARSQAVGTFLLPALAAVCATPMLARRFGKRRAYSTVSAGILVWTLVVNVLRPKVYDTPSMAVYVVLGCLLAFSAVVLLSQNQQTVLRPIRRFIDRPTENALAGRLAVAYPVAKRFRTGATLIMYTLIMLVLVLLTEIGGVLNKSIDSQVASATAGYAIRADFNPVGMSPDPVTSLRRGGEQNGVRAVAPLTSAFALSTDPGHRTTDPVDTVVVGVPAGATDQMEFEKRLAGLTTDAEVWRALATRPDAVVMDPFFGATGGPPGELYAPGDTFRVTDPRTGHGEQKTIVGILRNATVFYSPTKPSAFPVVTSDVAVKRQFGSAAVVSSALVRTYPALPTATVAAQLQGRYLSASLAATPIAATVRRLFDGNVAFFRLMEGFLALGLLVGISGLGVVMVRAVRERRRTIGILRALGFRSRTIERSFLAESAFVALEGVVLGSVLGVVTTWLMYQKSAAFNGIHTGFPVMWGTVAVMAVVTVAASLLATIGPARRASHILPALATRTAE